VQLPLEVDEEKLDCSGHSGIVNSRHFPPSPIVT
jgi:hypothetical protein